MEVKEIIRPENLVYERTPLMTDATLSYCPGCGHGTVHRLIMEVVEEGLYLCSNIWAIKLLSVISDIGKLLLNFS